MISAETAHSLLYRTVIVEISEWMRSTKRLPTAKLLARITRASKLAGGYEDVIDGETGEILYEGGATLWLPYSQTYNLYPDGEEPPVEELEDDDLAAALDEFEDPPRSFNELMERGQLEAEPMEYDRSPDPAWAREMVSGPIDELPPIELPPASTPRVALAGCKGECGRARMTFYAANVELTVDDEEGFPVRLNLADSDVSDLSLASFLMEAMLDNTVEVRPVAITVDALDRVKVVIKRFEEAAEAAKKDLLTENNGSRLRTLTVGSPNTAAVRRASMDLTRALADLRRPQ